MVLDEGVVEPAISEWASPVRLAPKKDGNLWFCVHFRRLNAIMVLHRYVISRMDECTESLFRAQLFPTLDANSGY